jgi:ParB/RepB/Spo0J family partition protein
MSTIQYLPASLLQPGEGNTRKTFSAESMESLKGSIRSYGVRRNLEVKPLAEGKYEIVTGERRWRATMELMEEREGELKQARSMLPCLVLDEHDVSRSDILNIIENLIRDDVPPGEEAEGYWALTQRENPESGELWTVTEIAAAVNQQPGYIRRRMQLRRAPAMILDAVNAKKIPVTIAELIGRIPSREQREVAAKLVLWPDNQEVPMDYEQARRAISERFYRTITRSGFNPDDEALVPMVMDEQTGERIYGGDCQSCPHRSGCALDKEELAGGNEDGGRGRKGGIDPNLCTHLECFRMKQEAAWKITRSLAEDKGMKCIEGDASRRVFSGDKGRLPNDSKYVDLDEKPREDMAGSTAETLPKWRALVSESKLKVEVIAARHPITGRAHYLIAKADAEKVLQATLKAADADVPAVTPPVEDATAAATTTTTTTTAQTTTEQAPVVTPVVDPVKEQKRLERHEKIIKHEVLIDSYELLYAAAVREGASHEVLMLSIELALNAAREACRPLAEWLKIRVKEAVTWRDYVRPILDYVETTMETPRAMEAFLHVCLAAQDTDARGVQAPAFERMAGALRVSVDLVESLVRRAHDMADGKEAEKVKDRSPLAEKPLIAERIQGTTDDPGRFIAELLSMQVPETAPNEHGVYVSPPAYELKVKHLRLSICLACKAGASAADDRFATGYHYSANKKGQHGDGGALPSDGEFFGTRELALVNELDALIKHLHKAEGYEPLVDAMRQALAQISVPPAATMIVMATKEEVKQIEEERVKPVGKREPKPRVAAPDVEAKALEHYLEHGSLKQAAEHAGVTRNTVGKWHSRHGWKEKREAHLAGKGEK